MAIKFINKTGDKRIELICNQLTKDSESGFIANIIKVRQMPFDQRYTSRDATPNKIADLWNQSGLEVYVLYYKSFNPFSSAYGKTYSSDPTTVYLNTRNMNRSDASVTSTIVHEGGHCLDISNPDLEFHHGDNSPIGKENTFQYWLDAKVYEHYSGVESTVDSSVTWYTPWYYRFWNWMHG